MGAKDMHGVMASFMDIALWLLTFLLFFCRMIIDINVNYAK